MFIQFIYLDNNENLAFKITIWQVNLREQFLPGPGFILVAQLVKALARRAWDPGSNPGPSENFSLKIFGYVSKVHKNSYK